MTYKDKWALAAQILIFIFGLSLITIFPSHKNLDAQYQGYAKDAMVNSSERSYCDTAIKKYKPRYYHGNWKIKCSSDLTNPKNKNIIYGVTLSKYKLILINRKTPFTKMTYTIGHEYAHAVAFDEKLQESKNWGKWVEYLTDNYGVIEDLTYFDKPNEILADNASRCYNHQQSEIEGFVTVDCEQLYKFFPVYKVENPIYTTVADKE